MGGHSIHADLDFTGFTAIHPDQSVTELQQDSEIAENKLGAMRGFVFALACESVLTFVGLCGWALWRAMH